jgi:serine/threonine protein kinase
VSLHRDVVIKEFFPPGALRARSGSGGRNVNEVVPAGQDHGQYYQQTRAAFLEKSRAVSRVWHPNVVMVYDTFEENNTAYMVMKLLKGKTLQQFLEEQLAQRTLPTTGAGAGLCTPYRPGLGSLAQGRSGSRRCLSRQRDAVPA